MLQKQHRFGLAFARCISPAALSRVSTMDSERWWACGMATVFVRPVDWGVFDVDALRPHEHSPRTFRVSGNR